MLEFDKIDAFFATTALLVW